MMRASSGAVSAPERQRRSQSPTDVGARRLTSAARLLGVDSKTMGGWLAAEIGAFLAHSDPRRRQPVYFTQQVRALTKGACLHPVGLIGGGRTAARTYNYFGLLAAKILSTLIDYGIPIEAQVQVEDALWDPRMKTEWNSLLDNPRQRGNIAMYFHVAAPRYPAEPWQLALSQQFEPFQPAQSVLILNLTHLFWHLPDRPESEKSQSPTDVGARRLSLETQR